MQSFVLPMMTMRRSPCPFTSLLLYYVHYCSAAQTTFDLFPSSYEEYDSWILDPEHGYGSPYAGFSRATRSRIASLPLFLPNTKTPYPNTAPPLHTQVRDSVGRLFLCRVYHQDELESLDDGMFELPKLRQDPTHQTSSTAAMDNKRSESSDSALSKAQEATSSASVLSNTNGGSEQQKSSILRPDSDSESYTSAQRLSQKDKIEALEEIDVLLEPLSGLCAQTHKGWWSYEWCYRESMTQFHVEISKTTSTVQVQDITSLGDYESRSLSMVTENGEEKHSRVNILAQGRPEVARVQDLHLHGTLCPGTSKERQTVVHLVCCSKSIVQNSMGLVHRNNVHVNTDLMSIYDINEPKTNPCTYNVTICTPLLCQDDQREEGNNHIHHDSHNALLKSRKTKSLPPKENESVMEILERTLNGFCLQTTTGGWWTYEICHKKSIRQYHEVVGSRKNKDGAVYSARTVEADHNLGNYQSSTFADILPEDEWKKVANATDKKGGVKKPYFELEYVGGDVCDHSDVTDAAIVAGGSTQEGVISRASSVRYQCGDNYDISVSEDSTCHYIVWVELPDLCKHPLFIQPVSKKQVMKCLYVPEGTEDGAF